MTVDQVDSYFAAAGLPKPSIEEFFAGLEAAGFCFSIEGPGLFIGFPDAERLGDTLTRFPLAMFSAEEMADFVRRRAADGRRRREGARQ